MLAGRLVLSFNYHSDIFGKKPVSQIFRQESVPQIKMHKTLIAKDGRSQPIQGQVLGPVLAMSYVKKTSK